MSPMFWIVAPEASPNRPTPVVEGRLIYNPVMILLLPLNVPVKGVEVFPTGAKPAPELHDWVSEASILLANL